jgi:hypothetical protein
MTNLPSPEYIRQHCTMPAPAPVICRTKQMRARRKQAGLTARGTKRLRRQWPELKGLNRRQYLTRMMQVRRAEMASTKTKP